MEQVVIRPMQSIDVLDLKRILKASFSSFEEGKVTHASLKRAEDLVNVYATEGSTFMVACINGRVVGGSGVGPLAGLPSTEGMGEIRDFAISSDYQGRGIGALVLQSTLISAKSYGYKRIYLETTPKMKQAQKLFRRHGFKPVVESHQSGQEENQGLSKKDKKNKKEDFPCYFVLETSISSKRLN